MAKSGRFSLSKIAVWVLLGLLFIGLAGFGLGDIVRSGFTTSVARVGDESISAQDFLRAFSREINQRNRAGQPMNQETAREAGLDQYVVGQLIRSAALKEETARLGLSVTDAVVQQEVASIPSFMGPDGTFNADQARFALRQQGMTEAQLREDVRFEAAREILQTTLGADLALPPAMVQTVLAYRNEQRSFAWVRLDAARFGGNVDAPTEAELRALHEAEATRYTRPETRQVSYAILDPASLVSGIEVDEAEVDREYDARKESFNTPERRSIQRLTFADAAEAVAAKARIEAGEVTLLDIAVERGFSEENISLGELTREAVDAGARDAVFGLTEPGIVGPVDSSLGPALFQVNAILLGQVTAEEDARAAIRTAIAARLTGSLAQELAAEVEDLVAGGATVEEIGEETEYTQGQVAVPLTDTGEGLAADATFRALTLAAELGIETDLSQLSDGRFIVLRVDEVEPAAVIPLEEVAERVEADWRQQRQIDAVTAQADALADRIRNGTPMSRAALGLGLTPAEAGPILRSATPDGVPATLVAEIFELPLDGVAVLAQDAAVYVARPLSVLSFDPTSPVAFIEMLQFQEVFNQSYVSDVMTYYVEAVATRGDPRIYPGVMDNALTMVTHQPMHQQY
ncbi:MAG: SurA N-terminal domain-containing protein [Pseudomonadota bacterium]